MRIYRHWKCPRCGRTVRMRGNVTSRACTCSDPEVLMELAEEPRIRKIDTEPFVTYLGEADIAPTQAELVEDLPEYEMPPALKALAEGKPLEKPLRRGIGYLRAEVDTATEEVSDAESDFGAGLDTETEPDTEPDVEPVAGSSAAPPEHPRSEAESPESDSGDGRPRKRGRRRRGRKPRDQRSEASGTPVRVQKSDTADGDSGDHPTATAADDDKPKRKRNRRRRRGRKPKDGGQTPPTTTSE